MALLLGIDVGTTGAKAILINAAGRVLVSATTEYPLLMPQPGWTEQDPEPWWNAATTSVRRVLKGARISGSEGTGIGLPGQLHARVRPAKTGQGRRRAIP